MAIRRIRTLIASWAAYWAVLAAVTLGPAALAIWRATRSGTSGSNVAVSFGDGRFSITVTQLGQTTYSASVSFIVLALWVAGPPLISWLFWLARRPKPEPVERVHS